MEGGGGPEQGGDGGRFGEVAADLRLDILLGVGFPKINPT